MADPESSILVASMGVCLEQHTNESSDCLVPGLECLLVVARAVADHEVVAESQVQNLAWVNLAMGHEVLQLAVSLEVAYSAVADPEVACHHHQPQWAVLKECIQEKPELYDVGQSSFSDR